jgi:parvulin-like peptidyl-prolyl isomerase
MARDSIKKGSLTEALFLWYSLERFAMRKLLCTFFSDTNILRALIGAFFMLTILSPAGPATVIDGIAIIVNKDAILVSEINEAMLPLMQEYRANYAGDELKKKMAELRDTVIKQAIETKLIIQVARANGITATDKAIDSRIRTVQERFSSEDEFLRALASKGKTFREYREEVAEQVLVQETIKRVLGLEESVLDNELQEYYDSHPDEFITEARVKLAQIFLEIPSGSTAERVEELRRKAEQIRIMAEEGADFSELAMKYSEGPYREQGGFIGVVSPNGILPELEEAVFGLKTGEISEVKQTTYGFHVLKAQEAMPSRKIAFEEAKPFIEERLNEKKRNEKYEEWIETLKKDAYIDIRI